MFLFFFGGGVGSQASGWRILSLSNRRVQRCFVLLIDDPFCNLTSFFLPIPERWLLRYISNKKKSAIEKIKHKLILVLMVYKKIQDDGLVDGWSFPSFMLRNIWRYIPLSPLDDLNCCSQRRPTCSNDSNTSMQIRMRFVDCDDDDGMDVGFLFFVQ